MRERCVDCEHIHFNSLREDLNYIIYKHRRLKIVAILYPGGKTAKNNPDLLGCAENALGLRDFLERNGHELVVLTDKESELDRHLPSTDVLITTPFWPAYITKERISNASKLRLILTAGVGSDHIDLAAARCERNYRGRDYREQRCKCSRASGNAYFSPYS